MTFIPAEYMFTDMIISSGKIGPNSYERTTCDTRSTTCSTSKSTSKTHTLYARAEFSTKDTTFLDCRLDKAIRNPEALAARLLFAPHSAFSNTVYFKRRSFKEYIWMDGLRPWIFAF